MFCPERLIILSSLADGQDVRVKKKWGFNTAKNVFLKFNFNKWISYMYFCLGNEL